MTDMPLQSPGALRRLWHQPVARAAIAVIVLVTLAAIIGPSCLPPAAREVSNTQFSPPSLTHLFGTDLEGRDLFYRVLQGARISLIVGFSGAFISFFIGTAYGLIAGYVGGRADAIMMRAVEILYSIPRLIIVLIAISTFNNHFRDALNTLGLTSLVASSRILILILCLGLIEWLTMARIVRGQVLSLKARQFVAAARSLVYLTLTVPAVILDESFLSFLGLGIQPPQSSWGSLLSEAAEVINPVHSNWWLLAFPALAMCLTLLSLNFLGDSIREAIDPRARR
jgi:peptide/nickel transport system permease protein/oligopeptide transport system permease protein